MKKVLLSVVGLIAFVPGVSFAITTVAPQGLNTSGLQSTVSGLTQVINYAIPFFIALAVIVFIIGVMRVILAKGPDDSKKARDFLIWAIVGMTVILGIFGIARLLISTFGLNPAQLDQGEIPGVGTVPATN